jgi:septal ring factor EnvC (AmiA/AmiB activator)
MGVSQGVVEAQVEASRLDDELKSERTRADDLEKDLIATKGDLDLTQGELEFARGIIEKMEVSKNEEDEYRNKKRGAKVAQRAEHMKQDEAKAARMDGITIAKDERGAELVKEGVELHEIDGIIAREFSETYGADWEEWCWLYG